MKDDVAMLCALIVFALCLLGIWSKLFRDNWLQFLGLVLLSIGAAVIFWHAMQTERANVRELLLLVGLVLYGLGTAFKTWRLNRGQRRPPGSILSRHW